MVVTWIDLKVKGQGHRMPEYVVVKAPTLMLGCQLPSSSQFCLISVLELLEVGPHPSEENL